MNELLEMLRGDDRAQRRCASTTLWGLASRRTAALNLVVEALTDENPRLRKELIRILDLVGDPVLAVLAEVGASDAPANLKKAAKEAFEQIRPAPGAPATRSRTSGRLRFER